MPEIPRGFNRLLPPAAGSRVARASSPCLGAARGRARIRRERPASAARAQGSGRRVSGHRPSNVDRPIVRDTSPATPRLPDRVSVSERSIHPVSLRRAPAARPTVRQSSVCHSTLCHRRRASPRRISAGPLVSQSGELPADHAAIRRHHRHQGSTRTDSLAAHQSPVTQDWFSAPSLPDSRRSERPPLRFCGVRRHAER